MFIYRAEMIAPLRLDCFACGTNLREHDFIGILQWGDQDDSDCEKVVLCGICYHSQQKQHIMERCRLCDHLTPSFEDVNRYGRAIPKENIARRIAIYSSKDEIENIILDLQEIIKDNAPDQETS